MRHWLADTDGIAPVIVASEAGAEKYRADGWRVEGPFVLDTTTGAVDALEAVREQLDTDPLLVALGDRLSTLRAIVAAGHRP
jgi:hypothetical protein